MSGVRWRSATFWLDYLVHPWYPMRLTAEPRPEFEMGDGMDTPLNVLGQPIQSCSHEPLTGWYRDGCCNTDETDRGVHTVCCRVTTRFLEFLREQGNNLMTPAPQHGFPGLRDGDQWCVCAGSWKQAFDEGIACPVVLEATHQRSLETISLDALLEFALAPEA